MVAPRAARASKPRTSKPRAATPRAATARPATSRSAPATRDAILDAAEHLLRDGGTEAVRLQEIAARVGVTHPALLYHFKNRDGLLAALFQRMSQRMREELLAEILRPPPPGEAMDLAEVFVRVFDRVADPQRAPLLAWLLACGAEPFPDGEGAGLAEIATRLHAMRAATDPRSAEDREGTRFGLLAVTLLMFGDLLLGGATRRRIGLRDDAATRARFRGWLGERLPAMIEAMRGGRR
ncbi:MAG: TetR/AcrR family transcriptional regulator [Deltaproteobacteria bacterium]|nr:TetR/AcrR family transcriptional regulator [Deltaproteobacteria bacterium]